MSGKDYFSGLGLFNGAIFSRQSVELFVVLVLVCIVYSNTLHVPFVVDDERYIISNPVLHDIRGFVDSDYAEKLIRQRQLDQNFRTRVVTFFSFALNHRLHGHSLVGYHIVNVLIHLLNGMLVYRLVQLTLRTPFALARGGDSFKTSPMSAPLLAALLFVCHPAQTQAVTYISQRFTSLSTMFYLGSMVAYISWRTPAESRIGLNACRGDRCASWKRPLLFCMSVVSALLAMLSKEISFTLPLAISLYEWFFLKGSKRERCLYLLPFLMTMLIIPLAVFGEKARYEDVVNLSAAINDAGPISPLSYLYTQFTVLVTYLQLLVLPVNQSLDHFQPVYPGFFHLPVILAALLLASLFGLAVYLFLRSEQTTGRQGLWLRVMSFGVMWFFLTNSVESTVLPLQDLIFEHRIYLPSVGFFLALTALLEMVHSLIGRSGAKIFAMLTIFLITGWSGATYARNDVWRDNLVLWADAAKKSPENFRPHFILGGLYESEGRDAEAIKELEAAVRVDPLSLDGWSELAGVYIKQGNNEKALLLLEKASRGLPKNNESIDVLAGRYLQINRFAEAESLLRKAISLNSESALVALGDLYMRQGRFDESLTVLTEAMRAAPDNADILFNIGLIRARKGDYAGAAEDFQRARLLNPEDEEVGRQLEYVLSMLKQ